MSAEQTTTRKQLQGYGATRYQSELITKNLTSVAKHGRAYAYAVGDVMVSIKEYSQHTRIKQTTRQSLETILQMLLERLNNVIEVPFGRTTAPKINKLARQLTQAMSNTDRALTELKATTATIKAKHSM